MTDGAICWPEQFPGEYQMAQKIWARADEEWPDRKRHCACSDGDPMVPCHHCPVDGRFVGNVRMFSNEIGGMLAVLGTCKRHGEVCLDMTNWDFEYFKEEQS